MSDPSSSLPELLDHRVIGSRLGMFVSDDLLGPGLPLWLPPGALVRRELERFVVDEELDRGYQHLVSPPLGKRELYEISGHWEHYAEGMFPPMLVGSSEVVLRPMNCPHHILAYRHRPRSHAELPLRFAEMGQMFRNELSGALEGLSRVRAMTLSDAHLFCAEDQVASEVAAVLAFVRDCYGRLGIGPDAFRLRLSLRGPGEKYVADDALWSRAEAELRRVLVAEGLPFVEAPGEAAFYGPKVDVQVVGAGGREETLSTVQLDFHLPERFDLSYLQPDGSHARPVMVHRSVVSTLERMVAFLLELHQGHLPPWLAPHQVRVLPVGAGAGEWAEEVRARLAAARLRVSLEGSGPLGGRIRSAVEACVPWVVVVGRREAESGSVALRYRDGSQVSFSLEELVGRLSAAVAAREPSPFV